MWFPEPQQYCYESGNHLQSTYRSQKSVIPLSTCVVRSLSFLFSGRIKCVRCDGLVRLINRFLLFLHPPLRSTVPSCLCPRFAGHSAPLPETDSRGCLRQLHRHPLSTNVPHAIVASPPSTFLKHAWRGGAAFSGHGRNPPRMAVPVGSWPIRGEQRGVLTKAPPH